MRKTAIRAATVAFASMAAVHSVWVSLPAIAASRNDPPRRIRLAVPGSPPARANATGGLDDGRPSVANLDPALHRALRRAAAEASEVGVGLEVNSGWRSAAEQNQLLREAIVKYGSEQEAARWVATPKTSAHVSGDAVDIGPASAAAWLSTFGPTYGLCRIYRNEPWHFELRPDAADHGCPSMYADPTHDPRMQ